MYTLDKRRSKMKKCSNCGEEFEGNCCPNCGTWTEESRICPKCGNKLNAGANFCNYCGFSLGGAPDNRPQKNGGSSFKEKMSKVGKWMKKHLFIVIPVAIVLVVAIILACAIPACVKAADNGTYYLLEYNGEMDKTTYFVIDSGEWKDENGDGGSYEKDGDKIVFYVELMGSKEVVASGTIKDGVLTLDDDGFKEVYVSESHKHKYGEWKTTTEPTCMEKGEETGVCACGAKEKRVINSSEHKVSDKWEFDNSQHFKICSVCKQQFESEKHNSSSNCTVCGYPSVEVDGFGFILNGDSKGYTLVSAERDKAIIIPATCKELPVTAIGNSAFSGCSTLTSITIPDSVTSIGNYAFRACSALTSITIPDGVTSIGSSAFSGCSSLKKATMPAFAIEYIPQQNLEEVIITSGESIGEDAFEYCSSLTSIIIPDSITSIGDRAFYDCSSLTSITIPHSVTSIGNYAFYGCSSLTSITIPDNVTNIGSYTFRGCSSLTSITIPDSVTSIGNFAFAYCSKLTSITIPDSVTSIGDSAFWYCSSLESVTIGNGVTSISYYAFSGCSSLEEIKFKDMASYCQINGLSNVDQNKVYIGGQKLTEMTSIVIPDGVTSIGDNAFYNCSSLTSVTIGDGVTSISYQAFIGCSSLTSITIPDSVTSISNSAFSGCSSLTDITFAGTKAQWKAIEKGYSWNNNTGNYTIHCTDGDI